MEFIPGSFYAPIFYNIIFLLVLLKIAFLFNPNKNMAWILAIFLVIFLGLRPIDETYLGDTSSYAIIYESIKYGDMEYFGSDWLFMNLMSLSAQSGFSVHVFFVIVEALYVFNFMFACRRIFRQHGYLAFLMVVSSFSFYSYGINTIRAGLAASFILLALSYVDGQRIKTGILAFIGVGIHTSMLLPVVAMVLGLLHKNSKHYFYVWILALLVSGIVGKQLELMLASSGLVGDDRFAGYLRKTDTTYNIGFRIDFILYSCVPVLAGYYYIFKKQYKDKVYVLFYNIYLIANSFWILVIRANYSDRFAYLSWFIYPIVLIYPLLKERLVVNQRRKIVMIVFFHALFTYIMYLR